MTARTWRMFAGRNPHEQTRDDFPFLNFGDHRYVEMYGRDPVAVEITEDPDGQYLGWLGFAFLHYKADEQPVMIQPERLFEMQFAYGSQAEVKRDRGEIVRLTVKETES